MRIQGVSWYLYLSSIRTVTLQEKPPKLHGLWQQASISYSHVCELANTHLGLASVHELDSGFFLIILEPEPI